MHTQVDQGTPQRSLAIIAFADGIVGAWQSIKPVDLYPIEKSVVVANQGVYARGVRVLYARRCTEYRHGEEPCRSSTKFSGKWQRGTASLPNSTSPQEAAAQVKTTIESGGALQLLGFARIRSLSKDDLKFNWDAGSVKPNLIWTAIFSTAVGLLIRVNLAGQPMADHQWLTRSPLLARASARWR